MYGTVADFLRDKISDGSSLSIVSAYFTIYAFNKLRDALAGIKKPHFSLDVSADGNGEKLRLQTRHHSVKPNYCIGW